jgi:hypothetical protein
LIVIPRAVKVVIFLYVNMPFILFLEAYKFLVLLPGNPENPSQTMRKLGRQVGA